MVSNTMATFASLTVHCARLSRSQVRSDSAERLLPPTSVFRRGRARDRAYLNPNSAAQRANLLAEKELLLKRHAALLTRVRELTSPELANSTTK